MKKLLALSNKYLAILLAFLKPLGFWGVGLVAALDSSSIPVPMDLFVAGYAWANPHRFYLSVLMASVGSAIGGLVPYFIGRAGGELFLLKRIDRTKYERMRDRFEKQEFLALMIPSMMPPPTPWKLFVFAAGVFEMRVLPFLLAVFAGRLVRWLVLSLLVLKLGPSAVSLITDLVRDHLTLFLSGLVLVFAAIGIWVVLKLRKKPGPAE